MTAKPELRRVARFMVANLIVSSIDAGLELHDRTEHGTDAEAAALEAELRAVADMIRRPLPIGYEPGRGSGSPILPEKADR